MKSPLNKRPLEETDELTTSDIAAGKQPQPERRPELVRSEHSQADAARAQQEATRPGASEPALNRTPEVTSEGSTPLFATEEAGDLRNKWNGIQTTFVDEPRRAVENADNLVASTMKRLAEIFAQERSKLEGQWDRGDNISTEDLRVAMQRYRSFFHRLLAI